MRLITLNSDIKYTAENKSFTVSGKLIPFDTSYTLRNPKTKGEMTFNFKESTGSEWDPTTIWIYESKGGYKFLLLNDDVTQANIDAYLTAKLGK